MSFLNLQNSKCMQKTLKGNAKSGKLRLQNTLLKKSKIKYEGTVKKKDITLDEIVKVITSFENHKFPGNGGLPAEFYKTLIDILKQDLLKLYTEISKRGEMPARLSQAVISCFYRKGDR